MDLQFPDADALADALIASCKLFHARGWVPATGGNFSARLDERHLLITASGAHKGELTRADFMVVDVDGQPLQSGRKSSYETGLHTQLYRHAPDIGSVLHVHSVANTVLSRRAGTIVLSGYELLKILPGITDPSVSIGIPVFGNDQDIARLARQVEARMREPTAIPAYLIAGHGLYTWGRTVREARYRLEALEFMFECELWSDRRNP
ncbi:MAG: methylthioribulose-1-phosphate dehydratase [Xanthomonadaceae bacterium]|nr:methylthioribulose-1-phosphate dehydratase [Xanthomonadaceae bacterium]